VRVAKAEGRAARAVESIGGLTSQCSGRAESTPFIFNGSCAPLIAGVIPPVPRSESSVAPLRRGSGGYNKRLNPTRGKRLSHVRCARSRVIRGVRFLLER